MRTHHSSSTKTSHDHDNTTVKVAQSSVTDTAAHCRRRAQTETLELCWLKVRIRRGTLRGTYDYILLKTTASAVVQAESPPASCDYKTEPNRLAHNASRLVLRNVSEFSTNPATPATCRADGTDGTASQWSGRSLYCTWSRDFEITTTTNLCL